MVEEEREEGRGVGEEKGRRWEGKEEEKGGRWEISWRAKARA